MAGTRATGQRQPVTWDVMEEHLDEAGFLWNLWSRALVSPDYSLGEVADGPEERLLAHVDGLVLGGPAVADRLLVPALAHDEPGVAFSGACALLAAGDEAGRRTVFGALAAAGERGEIVRTALRLSPSPGTTTALVAAWPSLAPTARPAVVEACMLTVSEPGRLLDEALNSGQPALVGAALEAAHRLGRLTAELVMYFVQGPDPELSRMALRVGLAAGLAPAWAWALESGRRGAGSDTDDGLLWLAMAGRADEQEPLFAAVGDPVRRAHALWALGFAGRARGAELCLELMDDPACARLAGEAFSAITGLAIAGPHAQPAPPEGDEDPPSEAPADAPGGRGVADLPLPARDAVAAWWSKERGRFRPDGRYLGGAPVTAELAVEALRTGPMRRRAPIALELGARAGGTAEVARALDLGAWARTQREALGTFSLPRPVVFDGAIGGRR